MNQIVRNILEVTMSTQHHPKLLFMAIWQHSQVVFTIEATHYYVTTYQPELQVREQGADTNQEPYTQSAGLIIRQKYHGKMCLELDVRKLEAFVK